MKHSAMLRGIAHETRVGVIASATDFRTAFLSRQRCAEDKEKLAITSAVMALIACIETNSSVISALTVWPVKPLASHHACVSSSMILKNQELDRAGVEREANRD